MQQHTSMWQLSMYCAVNCPRRCIWGIVPEHYSIVTCVESQEITRPDRIEVLPLGVEQKSLAIVREGSTEVIANRLMPIESDSQAKRGGEIDS